MRAQGNALTLPMDKEEMMGAQVAALPTLQQPSRLGGTVQTYVWQCQGQPLKVTYETLGNGPSVLLLPAFSTVSTRAELADLAQELAVRFQVVALDWPGFGDSDRQRLNYEPELYEQFLSQFVQAHFAEPIAVVAAGHAAGYAIKLAAQRLWSCLMLVAPTWRGPLAVMGAPSSIRQGVRELVRAPILGSLLYGLNTRPAFLKWMYRRHVFVDEAKLTPDYIERRYQSTQQKGA